MNDKEKPSAALVEALEETQGLLVAMCHEQRPLEEIQAQIDDNRAVLLAFAAAPTPAPSDAAVSDERAAQTIVQLSGKLVELGVNESGAGDMTLSMGARIVSVTGLSATETKALAPFLFQQITCSVEPKDCSTVPSDCPNNEGYGCGCSALAQTAPVGEAIYQVRETRSMHRPWIDTPQDNAEFLVKQGRHEMRVVYATPPASREALTLTDEQIVEVGKRHFREGHNRQAVRNFVAAVRDVIATAAQREGEKS
jgi:hypothetical protein